MLYFSFNSYTSIDRDDNELLLVIIEKKSRMMQDHGTF
jgi:hypothetical protein